MTRMETPESSRRDTRHMPRRKGAVGGVLLILLGLWGAVVPFVGPYFDFAFTPDRAWTWTSTRAWVEVLPGAVVIIGGLLLVASAHRGVTMLGGWLAAVGGAWYVVGPVLAEPLHVGAIGAPTGTTVGVRSLETLAYFAGLGTVMVFLAALAVGRFSVRATVTQPGRGEPGPAPEADPILGEPMRQHMDHAQNQRAHRYFRRRHSRESDPDTVFDEESVSSTHRGD